MYKFSTLILPILLLFTVASCAWSNEDDPNQTKNTVIQVTMRLGGAIRNDLFYYFVFNISGDPLKKPYSVFDDSEDRGKYWSVYYMYGTPPRRPTGIYRGRGGTTKQGVSRIDNPPLEQAYLSELLPINNIQGNQFILRIDLGQVSLKNINMNMIVCNQAIDADSRLEYEYDAYVYDSFYDRGLTLNLTGNILLWNEAQYSQELISNEHEDVAPPEANIVDWQFNVLSKAK
ncbi:MAG: hypothetical protein ABIC40_08680 [bacterium]